MRSRASSVLALLCLVQVALAGEAKPPREKLLQGFEKEALVGTAGPRKGRRYVFEVKDDVIRFGPTHPGGGYSWYANPVLEAHKGEVTEGEYALKSVLPIAGGGRGIRGVSTLRNAAILASYEGFDSRVDGKTFDTLFPRGWSGYELLRIDIRAERPETGHDTQVRLFICDDVLDPPLVCHYDLKPKRWVTIELDLGRAVKERDLNLKQMRFFLLGLGPDQKYRKPRTRRDREKGIVYVDNIRLARRDAPARLPVLKDETSFKITKPRAYAAEYVVGKDDKGRVYARGLRAASMEMPKPAEFERVPAPKALGEPVTIDLTKFKGLAISHLGLGGEPAALDAKHIIVPLSADFHSVPRHSFAAHDGKITLAIGTTDGGVTYKGLDGSDRPTVVMISHHAHGRAFAFGGELFVFADWGCWNPGHSYPMDKGFVRRTVFTGRGWWVSPYYFVDPHQLHCIGGHTAVRLRSGRIWHVWSPAWSFRPTGTCAKYSDDGGRTWQTWNDLGKFSFIPRLYGGHSSVVPYDGHVAVLVRRGMNQAMMSTWSGEGWSRPVKIPPVYRHNAVSPGGKDIYLAGEGGVWHFDGTKWKHELHTTPHPKSGAKPKLVVSGGTVLCFDRDKALKKVLCWRKVGGKWSKPGELVSTETSVSFSVPKQAPRGFVPLVYVVGETKEVIDELIKKGAHPRHVRRIKPWIKLLKVPVVLAAEMEEE